MKWLILLGFFFVLPLQCGGGCGPAEDPCDQDRQGCAPSPGLPTNATCAAEPMLSAEVGSGERTFLALSPGQVPEMHYGTQGGVHIFASARVRGAQLDRYDQLELIFSVQSPCADCPEGFVDAETRTALVGGDVPLQVADGVVEEPGFLLFADVLSYEDTPHRLRLLVRDPCGRTAEAVHLMADGQGRVDLGFVPGGSDAGLPDAVAPDAAAGQRDAMP